MATGALRVELSGGREPEMETVRACDGDRTCCGRDDDDVPEPACGGLCGGDAGGDGSCREPGRDSEPECDLVCAWGCAEEAADLTGSMSMPRWSTYVVDADVGRDTRGGFSSSPRRPASSSVELKTSGFT